MTARPVRTRDVPVITTLTLVLGSIQAALGVLTGSSVLLDLHESIPVTLAVATVLVGALQAALQPWAQAQAVPTEDVVEVRDGGSVVAGPANDMAAEGEHVRTIGYDPHHHVAG